MRLGISEQSEPSPRLHAGKAALSPVPVQSMSGAALVLVLACLALLTVVVISLMVGATQELNTSKTYSEQVQTRVLAASTLELVKGQIWAATTETNSGAAATSWASQPGAIRTFRSGDTNLLNVYKLYSSSNMVVPNSSYTPTSEVPANWASRPNEFVDLNRPVVVAGATNYPIFNPTASGIVAGFTNLASSAGVATTTSPLPMPVQWIYVLRDGTHTNSSVTNAPFNAANPVVGRIAFWTDDDTCKLNINTASATREGEVNGATATQSFWDLPYGAVGNERFLGRRQPAQREYQRYPGHPARIDLKTVLANMTASEIYNMTPRISSDDATVGSFGGTRFADSGPLALKRERLYATLDEFFYNTNRATNNAALTSANLNRLEGFLTAYNRAPELNLFGRPRVSMWPVNADPSKRTPLDKWFAICSTMVYGTNDSVTGTNLFSVTRSDSTSATADLTDAPGFTIRPLFAYLQNQTKDAPPGYSSSFLTKYSAAGRDQLLTLSLDYIRCVNLYDSSVTNGLLQGRPYNSNVYTVPQVNLTIYDKLKKPSPLIQVLPGKGQVVPLTISPANVPSSSGTFKGLGRFDTTVSEAAFHFWALSWDDGTPVREDDRIVVNGVTNTVGVFAQTATNMQKIAAIGAPLNPRGTGNPMYGAQLLISPFNTMCGYTRYAPDYLHRVTGLSGFTVNGASIFPADPAVNWVRAFVSHVSPGGGSSALYSTVADSVYPSGNRGLGKYAYFDGGTIDKPSQRDYPFVSRIFPVPDADATLNFSGGNLTLEIFSRAGELIQNLNLNFPSAPVIKPTPFSFPTVSPLPVGYDNYSYAPQGRRMRSAGHFYYSPSGQMCFQGDTIISMEANGPATDYRWLSLQSNVASTLFQSHPLYANTSNSSNKACGLRGGGQNDSSSLRPIHGMASATASSNITSSAGSLLGSGKVSLNKYKPLISSRYDTTGIRNAQGKLPDFETGFGDMPDGAYSRKPDEISIRRIQATQEMTDTYGSPYYFYAYGYGGGGDDGFGEDTYFAPNRQVPSPGIMGGLPSRASEAQGAWETLLFCPNPAAGTTSSDHRGFVSPPDYLWMDLFTMPIVEPYAISEPFSTAGKINMNYQIVPFTYVTRSTGLRAVLAANRATVIDLSLGWSTSLTRYPIHLNETLKQFQAKFDSNQIFKSPSEICSMWLYPGRTFSPTTALVTDTAGSSSGITAWWYTTGDKSGTGDNLREQPYTALYQNLTTQSNTYTVHVYVQALDQPPSGKLIITGEYRGSYALERFLDPKDPSLPDFILDPNSNAMGCYQFRVNNTTQFLP
jgi:uncharacterized protein (TIGR02600 family)